MTTFLPKILFFLVLCISVHVQARESQFFSKFIAKDANTNTAATQVDPTKEPSEFLHKQGQDPPVFVAESRNGYGLYGHETGQLPSFEVATATSLADEPYYHKDTYANDEGVVRNTNAMLQGSSSRNNNNNYFSAEEQRFRNSAANSRYTTNGNWVQQQGMSDTRFLGNGKYYYDINDEEKYDTTRYAEPRSVEFDSSNKAGYQPNANRNNNFGNEYKGNYPADNFAAENAKVMARGYDPVKNQYMFRPTKNGDEFMP